MDATLTGGIGGTVVELTAIMGGAATAGVEIAGTTAGVGTADEPVKTARGGTATFAGGMLDPTTVAGGTDGTITASGTIDPMIGAGAIGHAMFAGGETSRFLLRDHKPLAAVRVRVFSWIVLACAGKTIHEPRGQYRGEASFSLRRPLTGLSIFQGDWLPIDAIDSLLAAMQPLHS